jgi:hypothetical protein
MLIHERVSGADVLRQLFVTIDALLKRVQHGLTPPYLPREPRGGQPQLSAAEVVTMLVWGAWRGLNDKAKLYDYLCEHHRQAFPLLGAYSKFVDATTRSVVELRGLLALILAHQRQAHHTLAGGVPRLYGPANL